MRTNPFLLDEKNPQAFGNVPLAVDILESIATNFAGNGRPDFIEAGMIWFDESDKSFKFYNGTSDFVLANATNLVAGLLSASDKSKLDGIEAGATADQIAIEVPNDNSLLGRHYLTSSATNLQAVINALDKGYSWSPSVTVLAASMTPLDRDGLCASQTVEAAGQLLMNGALISGGRYTTGNRAVYRAITLYSAGDASGTKFRAMRRTMWGVVELGSWVDGPNAGQVILTSVMTEVDYIEANGPCAVAVEVGVSKPYLAMNPNLGINYYVNEETSDWGVLVMGFDALPSSTSSFAGVDAVMSLIVKKGASAKTISFAQGYGITTGVVMGPALELGTASKLIRYSIQILRDQSLALFSNANKEA